MANKMKEKRKDFAPAEGKKLDLRIVKTRKVLRATLVKMLEVDSIDDITVQELCLQANVNRMTFYKHYEDKYALLNDCFNEFRATVDANMKKHYSGITTPEAYCYGLLQELSDFCMENRRFIKTVLSGGNTSCTGIISDGLQAMFVSLLTRLYDEKAEKGEGEKKDAATISCLAAFITGGIESVALYWVNNPDSITRKGVLESFAPVIQAVFNPVNGEPPVFPTPVEAPAEGVRTKRKYHRRKKTEE